MSDQSALLFLGWSIFRSTAFAPAQPDPPLILAERPHSPPSHFRAPAPAAAAQRTPPPQPTSPPSAKLLSGSASASLSRPGSPTRRLAGFDLEGFALLPGDQLTTAQGDLKLLTLNGARVRLLPESSWTIAKNKQHPAGLQGAATIATDAPVDVSLGEARLRVQDAAVTAIARDGAEVEVRSGQATLFRGSTVVRLPSQTSATQRGSAQALKTRQRRRAPSVGWLRHISRMKMAAAASPSPARGPTPAPLKFTPEG